MDIKRAIVFAFLIGFLALMPWAKTKETTSNGNLCAYFRGLRFASPIILGFYLLLMYEAIHESTTANCGITFSEMVIIGTFFTLLFVAPLPYFITRKLTLAGDQLIAYSIFSGTKKVKLEDIESISDSYIWGGFIIKTPETRILVEKMLSGRQELLAAIERSRSNDRG